MKRVTAFYFGVCLRGTEVLAVFLAIGNLFACSDLRGQDYGYTLLEIGGAGGTLLQIGGLNDSGQVSGSNLVLDDSELHPFLSKINGGVLEDMGTLGGTFGHALAVNASGQVAGLSTTAAEAETHAFLSAAGGGALRDLGTLGGATSQAHSVNFRGQVAGWSNLAGNSASHAFLSAPDGGALKDLGTLGGSYSYARAVNASGQVTGGAAPAGDSGPHAFLSAPDGGALKDLGTLAGAIFSAGLSVNAPGQVAGFSGIEASAESDGWYHAFLSAADGGALQDLGTFGGIRSSAQGMNDSGEVVGWAELADGTTHAFLFTLAGGLQDLNLLIDPAAGITLTSAEDINALGQIAAYGTDSTGQPRAYLLSLASVPEPAAWAMLLLGSATIFGAARVRRAARD